jgi:hypothetical protein
MVFRVVLAVPLLGTAAGATAVAASPSAPAERPPAAPEISSTGSCPSADTIWTAMATLVPRGALAALPRSASVDVADLGETYRVRLTTGNSQRVRVYRDLARDCEQRARFAAVFVVLTLMPPELLIDSPPKLGMTPPSEPEITPPPSPESVATIAVAPAPTRRLRFELTALGDTAPAVLSAPEMTSPGGELRAAIGAGYLAALFAVGLQPRTDFTINGVVHARELRIPIDAGVRVRHVGQWLELAGDASLVAAIFRAEGVSPVVPRSATRVDLGLRAGIVLRIGGRDARLAPIAGLHTDYFPRPYDLATTPAGVVARTPSLRIGATAGIAASF